jgi:hypothetical protein
MAHRRRCAAIDAFAPLLEISPDTGEQSEPEHTQSDCGQRQGLRSRGNEASGKRQAGRPGTNSQAVAQHPARLKRPPTAESCATDRHPRVSRQRDRSDEGGPNGGNEQAARDSAPEDGKDVKVGAHDSDASRARR